MNTKLEKELDKYCKAKGVDIDECEYYTDNSTSETHEWRVYIPSIRKSTRVIYHKKTKKTSLHEFDGDIWARY